MEAPTQTETAVPEPSQIDHFPGERELNLAALVEASLEVYKTGELILRRLSPDNLRLILGIDEGGSVQQSGLRFHDVLDGREITSLPNFAGNNPINPASDQSDTVRGMVEVLLSGESHNLDLIVEGFDLGEADLQYSLTIIPGTTMSEDLRGKYISLIANHLKK